MTTSSPAGQEGEAWPAGAPCIGNPDPFYTTNVGPAAHREAKAICSICPGINQCLRWALRHDERYGVWGGLSPEERERIRKRTVAA